MEKQVDEPKRDLVLKCIKSVVFDNQILLMKHDQVKFIEWEATDDHEKQPAGMLVEVVKSAFDEGMELYLTVHQVAEYFEYRDITE